MISPETLSGPSWVIMMPLVKGMILFGEINLRRSNQMDLIAQLRHGPKLKADPKKKPPKKKKGNEVPTGLAKWRKAMDIKRFYKWRDRFRLFPNLEASTNELAALTGRGSMSVHSSLKTLSKPSLHRWVIKARRIPAAGNGGGRDQIIWKWIGPDELPESLSD